MEGALSQLEESRKIVCTRFDRVVRKYHALGTVSCLAKVFIPRLLQSKTRVNIGDKLGDVREGRTKL